MGLSETITAAIIGAGATMATAIFQLLRNRAPSEGRPKKNRIRSLLATIALMLGCIVGGYGWSSLRAVNANEQMRSTLQAEFTRQFAALAVHQSDNVPAAGAVPDGGALPASHTTTGGPGSLVQLPPCRPAERSDESGVATCTEQTAQTVALCAALPAAAQSTRLQVAVRSLKPDSTWHGGEADSPAIGDLHVSQALPEQTLGGTERLACLNVANWSVSDALTVRLLADYTIAPKTLPEPAVTPITASLQ